MKLINLAKIAREEAYAPYSKVKVGAALLTKEGSIYTGCNIENLRYGELICAERNAIYTAMANKQREFTEIAIVANYRGELKPCRICRSAIAELCPEIKIKTLNLKDNKMLELSLKELYNNKISYEVRSILRIILRKIFK